MKRKQVQLYTFKEKHIAQHYYLKIIIFYKIGVKMCNITIFKLTALSLCLMEIQLLDGNLTVMIFKRNCKK